MSVYLSVLASVKLSVCLLICPPVLLSNCLSACSTVYLSVKQYVTFVDCEGSSQSLYLSLFLSACLSVDFCVCVPVYLSVRLRICLPICLSHSMVIDLSICLDNFSTFSIENSWISSTSELSGPYNLIFCDHFSPFTSSHCNHFISCHKKEYNVCKTIPKRSIPILLLWQNIVLFTSASDVEILQSHNIQGEI